MSYGGGGGYGYGGGGGGGGGDFGGGGYGGGGGGGGGGYNDGGGGGYMANGGGASQGGGGGSASQGGGKQTSETITPVTIKQIHDAGKEEGGDKLKINGATIEQVTCVARIVEAGVQMTMLSFKLDDCTGKIEGSHILPADESGGHEFAVQKRERLKDNAWVRIVGIVDDNGDESGKRRLTIYKIRAVDDHNEILYHRVDAVKTFVSLTRPKKSGLSSNNINGNSALTSTGMGKNDVLSGHNNATTNGGAVAIPGGGVPVLGDDGISMTPLQREIFEYVKSRSPQSAGHGVALGDIQKDLSTRTTSAVVREIMEGFATDGHVYTSIDEDHFVFCEQ